MIDVKYVTETSFTQRAFAVLQSPQSFPIPLAGESV